MSDSIPYVAALLSKKDKALSEGVVALEYAMRLQQLELDCDLSAAERMGFEGAACRTNIEKFERAIKAMREAREA